MIGRLVRLDAKLLVRSPLAWTVLTLLALVAACSVASGLDWRERYVGAAAPMRAEVAEASAELVRIYDGMRNGSVTPTDVDTFGGSGEFIPDPTDPYVAGFYHERIAELPPGPLLGLAVGSTELAATHHKVQGTPLNGLLRVGEPAERVNPGALAAGRLDLLAFILLVCPLAIIALLFDATARERESGIAPLLAGLRVERRHLLAARGLVRGGLVLAVAIMTAAAAALLVGTTEPLRLMLWLLGIVIYLAFWTALCLAIASTRAGAVATAALTVGAWTFLVLVAPGLVERATRPSDLLESRAVADPNVRAVQREWGAPERKGARIGHVTRTIWNVQFGPLPACSRREGPLTDYSIRRLVDDSYTSDLRRGAAREALFDERLDAVGWTIPTLGLRRAMEHLAGVDPARQQAFRSAVVDYHAGNRDRVARALLECGRFSRADFDAAPAFRWSEPRVNTATILGGFGWPALLAFGLVAFALRRGSLVR